MHNDSNVGIYVQLLMEVNCECFPGEKSAHTNLNLTWCIEIYFI